MKKAIMAYEQWEREDVKSSFDMVVTPDEEQLDRNAYLKRMEKPEEPKIERSTRSPFAVYLDKAV